MSLVTSCPSCGTVFKMVREQLDASEGWVRCGHCMEVFDAKAQLHHQDDAALVASPDFNPSDLSFVQEAKQKAFWRSTGARFMLVALTLSLGALLLVQVLRQESINLANQDTIWSRLSITACQYWPCQPLLRRQLDAWVIESSTFQKEPAEGTTSFRLSLILKNNTRSALLVPAIELSLTDTNNAVLSRRVLQQADFGQATPADWQILIKPESSLGTVAGYRVILFYP